MRRRLIVSCLLLAGTAGTADMAFAGPDGHPTLLLKEEAGRRTRIDAPADELDAAFDRVSGEGGFSTEKLDAILDRLRGELRRERPRATPRLIAFLYPGPVTIEHLKSLREIFVDIELLLEPCDRAVCQAQVGRYIELIGQVLGQPVLVAAQYRLSFRTLTLTALTQTHGADMQVFRVPIADCLSASGRTGGGQALLESRRHAEEQYEPLVARAIAQRAAGLRLSLVVPPRVSRSAAGAEVTVRVRGDRNRVEDQVIAALSAAELGLRDHPGTPARVSLEVEMVVPMHRTEVRRFRCQGQDVDLYVQGRLSRGDLWQSYIQEVNRDKNATILDFSDGD